MKSADQTRVNEGAIPMDTGPLASTGTSTNSYVIWTLGAIIIVGIAAYVAYPNLFHTNSTMDLDSNAHTGMDNPAITGTNSNMRGNDTDSSEPQTGNSMATGTPSQSTNR